MVDYTDIPRDSRRVPLETRVQFKFDRFTGFISEYSANISPGGIFIRTKSPQPPGTALDLEFRLGDGYELIKGRGEVIWNRSEDEGAGRPAGMGIRFLELSEGSKDLIYRIVDEHVLQGGTPFDVTQRPPDPVPALEAAPPPFPDLFDPPVVPRPREPEPAPDVSSWLPALGEPASGPPASSEPFPELLSKPEPVAQPASASPMFTTTFGSASVQRPPRRILPWALLAAGVLLAAAAFLLWGRIQAPADPAAAEEAPPVRRSAGPASARAAAEPRPQPAAAAGAGEPPSAVVPPAAPTPTPAPPPVPAAEGPRLTRLDKVTWERTGGGTDVLLWGDGAIPPETYRRSRIEGNPPRELIRLSGVRGSRPQSRVTVGTPEVLQVRTGYHPEAGQGELHVVLDLAHPSVAVTGIEQEPQGLRIHLRRSR